MKVLVANRGEIAARILRTLQELHIPSVALYTEVDANAPHVWLADEAICIGEPLAYLDGTKVLDAAYRSHATAIHPGYGFLAEHAAFAQRSTDAGLTFIGPSPTAMATFGDKRAARALAQQLGIPVVPGAQQCDSADDARNAATRIGYPILLKAAGGGGGKGMRRVHDEHELAEAFGAAQREAQKAFADGRLLVEKYIHPARHIEVQLLADGTRAMSLGERECSLQRRYQKVVEEAPSPNIAQTLREKLENAAVTLAEAAGYGGAGTVEFLVADDGTFYFLEVNARLQVEHPVTELRSGLDLVAQQVLLAHGEPLPDPPTLRGHAIEARLNAEAPYEGFLPATGTLHFVDWPQRPRLRIDTGVRTGSHVTPYYDSLLAKVIAWGNTREEARRQLIEGLRETTLVGVTTNQMFLLDLLTRSFFVDHATYTTTLESETFAPPPTPAFALVAAATLAATPSGSGEHDAHADRYSPWARLGAFRMDP